MSIKWRRRVDTLLFLCGFPIAAIAMHIHTDFDAGNLEWWRYLGERLALYHEIEKPYLWYFLAAPLTGVMLALAGRVSWGFTSYGDARYASRWQIGKFGLRDARGVVLGAASGGQLITAKPRHIMVSAGTQSGKTQGIVIPTLLTYPGACVVIDAKGELWEETATARSKFSDVYRLEWTSRNTARYNPISIGLMPDDDAEIERQVYETATLLVPHLTSKDGSYFDNDAVGLLNALLAWEVFDARTTGREAYLTNVVHWLSEFDEDIEAAAKAAKISPLVAKLVEAKDLARERGYPRNVVGGLTEYAELAMGSARTFAGVVGTFRAALQSYRSGAVEYALSGSDFTPLSLVDGKRPGTVYIVTAAKDREFVSSMTTALISNIIFTLISRSKADARAHHQMLLLLEEFTSLKRTEAVPEVYDRGAGMGVHVMTVIQAFSQIQEKYGREALDTFLQNTDYIAAFAQGDKNSREMLAEMVGKETRMRHSRSEGGRGDSFSENLEGVPLILPQDWGSLKLGEHRVLVKRHHNRPIKARTAFAFNNRRYKHLLGGTPLPPVRPEGAGNG